MSCKTALFALICKLKLCSEWFLAKQKRKRNCFAKLKNYDSVLLRLEKTLGPKVPVFYLGGQAVFFLEESCKFLQKSQIIRFLEIGIPVYCTEVIGDSWAIDMPEDVEIVTRIMKERDEKV